MICSSMKLGWLLLSNLWQKYYKDTFYNYFEWVGRPCSCFLRVGTARWPTKQTVTRFGNKMLSVDVGRNFFVTYRCNWVSIQPLAGAVHAACWLCIESRFRSLCCFDGVGYKGFLTISVVAFQIHGTKAAIFETRVCQRHICGRVNR